MKIDACLCTGYTFESLHRLAREQDLTLESLSEKTGCGRHCGWCVAYVKRMLATGETSFGEMLPREESFNKKDIL